MRLTEKQEGNEKYYQGKRKGFKVVVSEFQKEENVAVKFMVNIVHREDDIRFHSYGIAGAESILFPSIERAREFAVDKIDKAVEGNYAGWVGKDVPNRPTEPPTINEDDSDYDHNATYEKGDEVDGKVQS